MRLGDPTEVGPGIWRASDGALINVGQGDSANPGLLSTYEAQLRAKRPAAVVAPPPPPVVKLAAPPIAPAVATIKPVATIAPTQAAVQQAVSHAQQAAQPTYITIPSEAPTRKQIAPAPPPAMPTWVVPAGLGVAALMAVMLMKRKVKR